MIKVKSFYWINGLFYILLGLFLCLKPELSLKTIIIIASIEIIIAWIIWIIVDLTTTIYSWRKALMLFSIFQIIFWIILLLFPEIWEFIAALFVVILGIWCVIKGILITVDAFKTKKLQISNRWLLLLTWIIVILFGLFLTTNAFLEVIIITILVGLGMVLYGIRMLTIGFQVKKKIITNVEEDFEEDFEETDEE